VRRAFRRTTSRPMIWCVEKRDAPYRDIRAMPLIVWKRLPYLFQAIKQRIAENFFTTSESIEKRYENPNGRG
jgi:hypothetical protein